MPGELSSAPPVSGHRTLIDLLWHDAEAAMIVIDAEHRLLQGNPSAMATLGALGYVIGDVVTGSAAQVMSAEGGTSLPPEERPVERALRGETVTRQPVVVDFGDGCGQHRMVLSAQPIEVSDDGTTGALLVWHDVTDTWQFAERSRTELTRLSQLLEGASDYAIVMLDEAGAVQTWSPAAEAMQGYTEAQAIGLPFARFFDDGDRATGLPKKILTKAAGRGKVQVEGKRVRRDGSVFWAHVALTALRDEGGRLRGFVKVTHDVSEQRAGERASVELNELLEERVAERTVQLEQQAADLAAVNSELEAFSYSVSHDLRAPLRAMNGFARIMEEEFGDQLSPGAMHYLRKVTENAQQMGSLIDALLSFSRMQRQSLRSTPIDMTEMVRECWAQLASAREDREIEFVLPQLPAGMGDRRLIQQVWVNLLDNAIKYTGRRSGARVEVAAQIQKGGVWTDGGQPGLPNGLGGPVNGWIGDWADPDEVDDIVLYTVRDNGAGFDMRYASKIGQVFQRLHHAEDFAGTGIGLALVQRIVQRHGGRLSAIGAPEAGATFGFTLRAMS
jgi:PAS domain S-box-containing protein